MRKYLIIGCGVAGINAAEAIRSTDPSSGITIISNDSHGFYSRPGLAYYLTGELPQKQLYIYTKTDWCKLNAHFVHGQVTRVVTDEHRIIINHSDVIGYDRLLVATGASAVRSNLPGAELQGVVYLDSLEDTRQIIHQTRRTRTAVVVGGGILAHGLPAVHHAVAALAPAPGPLAWLLPLAADAGVGVAAGALALMAVRLIRSMFRKR